VRPDHRQRGYAGEILGQALVIEGASGVFEDIRARTRRYWIARRPPLVVASSWR
jgi:predicted acetyltransferase